MEYKELITSAHLGNNMMSSMAVQASGLQDRMAEPKKEKECNSSTKSSHCSVLVHTTQKTARVPAFSMYAGILDSGNKR